MPNRKHKVVLIGSKGFQRSAKGVQVDCFLWSQISKIKNIRDYDTVILNLLSISDSDDRNKVAWNKFNQLLDFHSTTDILINGGMIIVVGDPRFTIPSNDTKKDKKENIDKISESIFLEWTGVKYGWDSEPGDTVIFQDDYDHRYFSDYIEKLIKWEYSLSLCELNTNTISKRFNLSYIEDKGKELFLKKDFFCCNRYQNALAFILRLQYRRKGRYGPEVLESFGPLIFLPEINLSEDDTIQLILSSICGVETDLPEPEWLIDYFAPGQKTIDNKIALINAELINTHYKLTQAEKERETSRKCLKLLYEREYALEPVVRDMLRGLGAHVEDPEEKNKEDGWLVVTGSKNIREGVLEIKSTRLDQFGEDGRKQLLDWINRGRTIRGKNYKGIFIGNSAVDKPVNERAWAFSDSWSKAAELSSICALKTEDLYIIHLLNSKGILDLESFWEELFTTNGIFEMKNYREMLIPKDDDQS